MKLFLDTADNQAIKQWAQTGLIDGITTNPTHLSKEGGDPTRRVEEICNLLPNGVISVEITEKEPEAVYKQAKAIAALAPNIIVKVPCHRDYYAVIKRLVDDGIKLNITLVFTMLQALMMAKLGVCYVSPFVGRWDDIDADGMQVVYDVRTMLDEYDFSTQLLAASIRHIRHFHEAVLAGSDAVTIPLDVLKKASAHVLTDRGMESFDADWQKLGIKQFP